MELPRLSGHPAKGITLLSFSYIAERFSYYGVRSVMVLYFVHQLGVVKSEAAGLYGLFTMAVYFSPLIGALLGDLLIGSTAAIIAGGIIEAIGCFCLAIPGQRTAMLGMMLIVLGSGLFKPNMLQQVSSIYVNRVRYMDAGFSIIYFAINIGAFLGAFISLMFDHAGQINYSLCFSFAGFVSLFSIVPVLVDYKEMKISFLAKKYSSSPLTTNSTIALISILILLPIFWSISEMVGLIGNGSNSNSFMSETLTLLFLSGPVSIVLWSFVKMRSVYKIGLGFLWLGIPVSLALFMELKSLSLFANISEVLIVIPALSVISRFAPPRLTGLFFALSIALTYFSNKLVIIFENLLQKNYWDAMALMTLLSFCAGTLFVILGRTFPRDEEGNLL